MSGDKKKSMKEPPGSWGLPLLGSTSRVWSDFVGYVLETMSLPSNRHPTPKEFSHPCPVFKSAILGCSVAVVTTAKGRQEAFSDERSSAFTHHGGYHSLLSGALGISTVTMDEPDYVNLVREVFAPLFSEEMIEKYIPTMMRVAQHHVKDWLRKDNIAGTGEGVKAYQVLKGLFSDMVYEVFFGKIPKLDKKKIMEDCGLVFTGATAFPVSGGSIFSSSYDKGKESGSRLKKVVKDTLLRLIAENSSRDEKTFKVEERCIIESVGARICEILKKSAKNDDPCVHIQGSPQKTLTDLCASHLVLFTTGLTTKLLASLSLSFLRVLHNPRNMAWLDAVRKEASRLGRSHQLSPSAKASERYPKYVDLMQMKALEQICLEIERVFTPLAGLSRGTQDKDASLCGYKIPKNWLVWSCNFTCNRDRTVFPIHPNKFMPERWRSKKKEDTKKSPESQDEKRTQVEFCRENVSKGRHLAFGMGRRKCFGTHLALGMWKSFCYIVTVQTHWYSHFDFIPNPIFTIWL
ncbi:hypothetical protein AAMO2058_000286100 [Amorphochlora amoebiformis]